MSKKSPYLRREELSAVAGVALSYCYARMKTGQFPMPVHLPGEGLRPYWKRADVEAFAESLGARRKPKCEVCREARLEGAQVSRHHGDRAECQKVPLR